MSLLARLAPHLPYVRRYARALTGDQTTGDHYVRVALEALAAGEQTLSEQLSPGAPPAPGWKTAPPPTIPAIRPPG